MAALTASRVQLLQAEVDAGEEEDSHFRFLVDGNSFKYVSMAPGIMDVDDMCFAPALILALPTFPEGDWNTGHIVKDEDTGQLVFERTTVERLPSIEDRWQSTSVDHLELKFGKKLLSQVYEATTSRFDMPVVAKFARFEWEVQYLRDEYSAYSWIEGHNIGPRFLALLTEGSRATGIVIERITGARHASPDDLHICQQALARLHSLGIAHGDINKHNFLIKDGQVTIIDFYTARKDQPQPVLDAEMQLLPKELADTSGKGGRITMTEEEYRNSCQ